MAWLLGRRDVRLGEEIKRKRRLTASRKKKEKALAAKEQKNKGFDVLTWGGDPQSPPFLIEFSPLNSYMVSRKDENIFPSSQTLTPKLPHAQNGYSNIPCNKE